MSLEYNESCCWTIEKFSFFHNYFAIIELSIQQITLLTSFLSNIRSELGLALSSFARMLPIASSCVSAGGVMSMLSWQRSVNCPTRCSCAGILTI